MDSCHILRPCARRDFIITSYFPDEMGVLRPVMPDRCSKALLGDSPPCDLEVRHWRERKTGPRFALLVVKCHTHGFAFTLYPPGHVPYGRCAIAPVDPEGWPMHRVEDGSPERALAWDASIVRAALDAARGEPWPRSNGDWTGAVGSWRTQGRYLGQLAEILGLVGAQDSPLVGPLGVSALSQREATTAYVGATGYRERGRALCMIVGELASARCDLLELILAAGWESGLWGRPLRWDARAGQLREVVPKARSP
jgi:hypothetical protein